MQLISTVEDLRTARRGLTGKAGFVPTMGALHQGHASLVRQSVAENDLTFVSIFVNPTQFGPNEDLDKYPRTFEADVALLESLGVDFLFAPNVADIYPKGEAQISFQIRDLDKVLCGASRPGHMNGVVQVVSILFHLVQPDKAYFGQKDYQQFLILKTMATELHMPVQVVPCPIVREPDGLAMSSRNRYLGREEREQALFLSRLIQAIQQQRGQWTSLAQIQEFAAAELSQYPLVRLDYLEVLDGRSLKPLHDLSPESHPHIFVAAFLGTTRLIDNAPLWNDR